MKTNSFPTSSPCLHTFTCTHCTSKHTLNKNNAAIQKCSLVLRLLNTHNEAKQKETAEFTEQFLDFHTNDGISHFNVRIFTSVTRNANRIYMAPYCLEELHNSLDSLALPHSLYASRKRFSFWINILDIKSVSISVTTSL